MKILIGYDGSHCAEAALDDLLQAGLPAEAEVVVLSVAEVWFPPPPSSYELNLMVSEDDNPATGTISPAFDSALSPAGALASQACQRLSKQFDRWTVRAESHFGSPASEIIRKADEWGPDLVVVGSHGHSAIGRFALGSVSQKVLTEARCSVRVARGRVEETASPARIIVGVDGSDGSDAAIDAVKHRSWPPGTEIFLIAVEDPILATNVGSLIAQVENVVEQFNEEQRDWAQGIVARREKSLASDGPRVKTAVKSGDPRRVLCEEAARWGADCIFLGARGLGSLDRFLLGSVSSAVAARAHCSVEVVRSAGDKSNHALRP